LFTQGTIHHNRTSLQFEFLAVSLSILLAMWPIAIYP